MNVDPQLLLSRSFSSFEELAAMVVAWDLDFRQISRSRCASDVIQIQVGETLFTHLTCGCFSRHAGATPDDCYTIAVPDQGCSEFRYSKLPVSRPAMMITGPGHEFELLTRPGYAITTFSVPQPVIDRYFASGFDRSLNQLLNSSNGLVFVNPKAIVKVKEFTRDLYRLVDTPGAPQAQSDPDLTLESQLLSSIFDALLQGDGDSRELNGKARRRVFTRALDYAKSNREFPLSVQDLAEAAQTTERTLERAFKQEFGIPPQKYLFGRRMSGAHRQLWQSEVTETSVAAVANDWGFWHMGQFAKDYRRLFGELPSETLRRAGSQIRVKPPQTELV